MVAFKIAKALKEHYTVFRRWKRKVDTVTDDIQLCRWDFLIGTYRAVDEDWAHEACKDIVADTQMKTAREAFTQLRNDSSIQIVTELYSGGLPVANGDMNIFTGEREDPTPEHFVVSRLKAAWHDEQHHPAVDVLFDGLEDETDRKAFKTYVGYALTPGCELRKMMLLYGNPRSGKSTICNAINKAVIGMDNVKVFNLNQDFSDGDAGRFGLEGWEGARYQIVRQYTVRDAEGNSRTVCGFVARFSHDRKENQKFVREAAEKALERKGGSGDGVILKLDAGVDRTLRQNTS